MTQTDIDHILSKYENRPLKFKSQSLQITQRKNDDRGRRMVTFMDETGTPIKENNNANYNQIQLLRRLDQVQKTLTISQRKYAELYRKYDRTMHLNKQIEEELEKERRSRLQELIDLQNKLHLLETDNKKTVQITKEKDHKIAVLKEKLLQKNDQLQTCQKELEEINFKLCSTIIMKEEQSSAMIMKEREEGKLENHRSLVEMTQRYENQISDLKKEVKRFDNIFIEKEKQKKTLLLEMEEMSSNHQIELSEARNSIIKNQQQYRRWLDEVKQQKLELIEKYELEIQELRRAQINKKVETSHGSQVSKNVVRDFEKQIRLLQNELYIKKSQIETLVRADHENQLKLKKLENQLYSLKGDYAKKLLEIKRYLGQLEISEKSLQKQKQRGDSLEIEIQKLKNKCEQVLSENERICVENQSLKKDMNSELSSLVEIRKQLNNATDNKININATLTQNSVKLKNRIGVLEEEIENITSQLYAERLENAKLKQEIKETKVQLKQQYDLSIENTKKQLQEQVRKVQGTSFDELQRQTTYLQLRELQHKYEMMTSQVITVDELMRTATKIHKYYKK